VAGASFQTAKQLMREYAFADPALVRAIYDPSGPLLNGTCCCKRDGVR
jgi:hypothetical protein